MNKILKDIYIDDVELFVENIMDKMYGMDDCYTVTLVGKYQEIQLALKSIMCYDVQIVHIEFSSGELDGYNDEYYLSIDLVDGIFEICCCPAKNEGDGVIDYANETYIFENCGSQIVKCCCADEKFLVNINNYDEYYEENSEEECANKTLENEEPNNIIVKSKDYNLELFQNKKGDISGFKFNTNIGNLKQDYEFHTNRKIDTSEIYKMITKMCY